MNEKKEEMKVEEKEVNEINNEMNNEMNDDEISEVAGGNTVSFPSISLVGLIGKR